MMKRFVLILTLPAAFGTFVSCLPDPGVVLPRNGTVTGGGGQNVPGTGGVSPGSGGQTGVGGQIGVGAQTGSGGAQGTGGVLGSGGSPGTGGTAGRGTGGSATGGVAGAGTGGRGTGGTATGGTPGTGGTLGTGGIAMGTGGATATACTIPGSPNAGAGSFTFYNFGQGTPAAQEGGGFRTACGYFGTETNGATSDTVQNIATPNYFAAIPGQTPQNFNNSGSCGACALITNGARSVVVTIVDECPLNTNPLCTDGHLDLSRPAFDALGFPVGNPSGTTWRFVPCPVTGNVKVRMKTGNPNEIFIENERVAIKSVTLAGQAGVRQSYGAWHWANNIPSGASLTLVDAANRTINVTVSSLAANQNQDTGVQFPACQ